MDDPIIIAENLGKKYKLGQQRGGYLALREVLAESVWSVFRRCRAAKSPGCGTPSNRNPESREFWALRDVSFDVRRGESIGIIGPNGAGKSTLLKILSRITEPTTGRFRLRGRVASLLEVGTGFHGELTGRENIFMNGAVLGMSKLEIKRKFDEIVHFAEIEKFLETPVKRYSSGMYLRLAFAVAAHLEPEILVIDEVLAVGDVEFQRKCLGKMDDAVRGGRTVLFVSHNLAAVQNLCSRGILLKFGMVAKTGTITEVVADYLAGQKRAASQPIAERQDRFGDGRARIVDLTLNGSSACIPTSVCCGDQVQFKLDYTVHGPIAAPAFALGIRDTSGIQILYMNSRLSGIPVRCAMPRSSVYCLIPRITLAPGQYTVHASVWGDDGSIVDRVEGAMILNVEAGPFYARADDSMLSFGKCLIDHTWTTEVPTTT